MGWVREGHGAVGDPGSSAPPPRTVDCPHNPPQTAQHFWVPGSHSGPYGISSPVHTQKLHIARLGRKGRRPGPREAAQSHLPGDSWAREMNPLLLLLLLLRCAAIVIGMCCVLRTFLRGKCVLCVALSCTCRILLHLGWGWGGGGACPVTPPPSRQPFHPVQLASVPWV